MMVLSAWSHAQEWIRLVLTGTHPLHHCRSDAVLAVAVGCGIANIAMRAKDESLTQMLGSGELGLDYSAQALALSLAIPVAILCGLLPSVSVSGMIDEFGLPSVSLAFATTAGIAAYIATRRRSAVTLLLALVPLTGAFLWASRVEPIYSALNRPLIDGLSVSWVVTIPLIAYATMKLTRRFVTELRPQDMTPFVRGALSGLSIAIGLSMLATATFVSTYGEVCRR